MSISSSKMPLISLHQWDEDRKTTGVVYDHSQARPITSKNNIKKSRQAAFMSALTQRKQSPGLHHQAKSTTSDSLNQEQYQAQSER